jgi:hypothetical protein
MRYRGSRRRAQTCQADEDEAASYGEDCPQHAQKGAERIRRAGAGQQPYSGRDARRYDRTVARIPLHRNGKRPECGSSQESLPAIPRNIASRRHNRIARRLLLDRPMNVLSFHRSQGHWRDALAMFPPIGGGKQCPGYVERPRQKDRDIKNSSILRVSEKRVPLCPARCPALAGTLGAGHRCPVF